MVFNRGEDHYYFDDVKVNCAECGHYGYMRPHNVGIGAPVCLECAMIAMADDPNPVISCTDKTLLEVVATLEEMKKGH